MHPNFDRLFSLNLRVYEMYVHCTYGRFHIGVNRKLKIHENHI